MKRFFAVIAIALFGMVQTQAWAQQGTRPGNWLTVTGEGRVDSAPDMATITMGVQSQAKSAADALRQTSVATGEMLTLLSESGIETRDMQTRDLSLSPIWDNRSRENDMPPKIAGYTATNTVIVRVRSLGDLGVILDDVVQSGANRFHGLSFGLQDPGPVRDEARRAAVAEAMRKAKLYADAAGLSLGDVLELNESVGGSPRPMEMSRMAMAESVPVAQGEVATTAMVTMVFEIEQQ